MKKVLYTVDRIEEGIFVLENRETLETLNAGKEVITFDVKEGDILELTFDEAGNIAEATICNELTNNVLRENKKKLGSLFDN